jgi:glycosyltransferase involved in cell wall biosynthesis
MTGAHRPPRVVVFVDGCYLPPRDGISALRLNMVRHLARIGVPMCVIHCYRGWADPGYFGDEPYPSLLLSPDTFYDPATYAPGGHVWNKLAQFEPTVVQSDYLSVLRGPAALISNEFNAAVVAEMPYVPSRFFRDQTLGAAAMRELDWLLAGFRDSVDAVVCWSADDKIELCRELHLPASRGYALRAPLDIPPAAVDHDGSPALLFLGNLFFHQNATALRYIADTVLPIVRAERPEVTLSVVGDCPPGLNSCYARREIRFLGYRHDLSSVWSHALAALAPMATMNGGVHTKVLTALAAGVPVLGSASAARGIPPMTGLYVCRTPTDYRDNLEPLLSGDGIRRRVGRAAHATVANVFDNFNTAARLKDAYVEVLGSDVRRKRCIVTPSATPLELRETLRSGRFSEPASTMRRLDGVPWYFAGLSPTALARPDADRRHTRAPRESGA